MSSLNDPRPHLSGVGISHPDRVVYPAPRLTKLDIARYYASIESDPWNDYWSCRQKLTATRIRAVADHELNK